MSEHLEAGAMGEGERLGRTEAVSQLFLSHHRRLVGLAALLVGDSGAAEEVVQDAFVGLHRRWRHLRDRGAAVAYLNRAVVNGSRDRLRRGRTAAVAMPRMLPVAEGLTSAEQDAVRHDEADRLWHALGELPQRQRQVLVLRYYLEQSETEIADLLEVSRGSVKKHASRGLATLARTWETGR